MRLSPWRYPGSKAAKAHQKNILKALRIGTWEGEYLEPFVGGGSIALSVAKAMPDVQLRLFDLDAKVGSWWKLVATGSDSEFDELCCLIEDTKVTLELHAESRKVGNTGTLLAKAYAGIFLNRTSYSGALNGGPIGGQKQESKYPINCRWNAETLIRQHHRVRELLFGRTKAGTMDFGESMNKYPNAVVYADPPYESKGQVCYPEWLKGNGHERLKEALQKRDRWVLSYNDNIEIERRYAGYEMLRYDKKYSMKEGANYNGKELLIIGWR